jgi:hypothetical protein
MDLVFLILIFFIFHSDSLSSFFDIENQLDKIHELNNFAENMVKPTFSALIS